MTTFLVAFIVGILAFFFGLKHGHSGGMEDGRAEMFKEIKEALLKAKGEAEI